MAESCVLRITAYGCNVQVEAPDAGVREIVDRHLLPTLPRVRQFAGEPHGIARIETVEGGFVLGAPGEPRSFAPSARQMLPFVIRALDDMVIRHLRGLFAVHAGTVAWRGRALLIPGMSHAGKSSLVAALLRRGATYYSDEYALIDADGLVHPYPRPLMVRDGRPFQEPVLPDDLHASTGSEPIPVGWIFVVKFRKDGTWDVKPIEQSQAVFSLLQHTPHSLADSPAMMSHFERAVCHAKGFCGERGKADEAAEKILKMVSASVETECFHPD